MPLRRFTTIKWGLLATPVACLSGRQLRPSIFMPGSLQSLQHGTNGQETGFTAMGASWTKMGRQYITSHTQMIPYCSSKILEMQYVMLKRDGSFLIERTTSSHAP